MKAKRTKRTKSAKTLKAAAAAKRVVKRKEGAMSDGEFSKLTSKELQELRVKVDRLIATRQSEERNALKDQFREMAEAAGFQLGEVVSGRGGKGRTVAAKYANPDDPSETWTGRGRQPRWLSAKLRAGAQLEDFLL